MATTTTTRQPGPEELVDLAQPITPLSMDLRELELKRRERDVSYLEKAVWKFAQKVEKQELDLCDQFERLKSVDREEARLARLRDLLQGHLDEALSPYLEIEHDKQRRLEKRIDQLEFTNAQLKRERHAAEGRKSDYDRGLTGDRRTDNKIVARKVEEELVRREAELVRHATEEKDFATRRAQELEGKLARAIATISKLKKKVNIASKCNGKLKEQRDKYRRQLAVAQSLQQGFLPDADDDNPMHGAYDDPEASHVAALREIDRADRNLCNLALTEKKDTATQTDAYASADNGLSVLADGTAIFSAELYKAAQSEYQKYQKLLETASSLQRELEELEVIKASEQARAESLDMERARQHKELDLARRKYLKALGHIQGLQPTAEVIQKMADDANTEFEKVMETYQDPDKYMQFVTLLASDCKLGNNLGGIQMFAGTVVDGLKETDDGMKFANEESAVREVLGLQD
jgi:chromosome segregation ATPase